MRVYLNGSSTPTYNDWGGTATTAGASYGTATVSGSRQYQIEVDDWEAYSGTGTATVQLWAKNTAITPPAFVVPSNWLTPIATGVPPGWNLVSNAATVQWIRAEDEGSQVVLHGPSGDTATFTQLTPGLYQAPAGVSDYLNVDRPAIPAPGSSCATKSNPTPALHDLYPYVRSPGGTEGRFAYPRSLYRQGHRSSGP
jgi:hypothetical protein